MKFKLIEYFSEVKLEKLVKKYFGATQDWRVAGWLLTNGEMICLSSTGAPVDKDWYRDHDHGEICFVYKASGIQLQEDKDPQEDFMNRGNIRLIPEEPGIEISKDTEPTDKQYSTLFDFIKNSINESGQFALDFNYIGKYSSSTYGEIDTTARYYRGKNAKAERVINDLKYFYKTGELPYMSDLNDFREGLNNEI